MNRSDEGENRTPPCKLAAMPKTYRSGGRTREEANMGGDGTGW
jgi:hypothetical protein